MNTDARDADLATIRSVLSEYPVRLGLLYGSAAKGRMHSESDYDIAVYMEGNPADPKYTTRFTSLITALGNCVARDVDVVDLKTTNSRFSGRLIDESVVIYDPDGEAKTILKRVPAERPTKAELREETAELKDRLNPNP